MFYNVLIAFLSILSSMCILWKRVLFPNSPQRRGNWWTDENSRHWLGHSYCGVRSPHVQLSILHYSNLLCQPLREEEHWARPRPLGADVILAHFCLCLLWEWKGMGKFISHSLFRSSRVAPQCFCDFIILVITWISAFAVVGRSVFSLIFTMLA